MLLPVNCSKTFIRKSILLRLLADGSSRSSFQNCAYLQRKTTPLPPCNKKQKTIRSILQEKFTLLYVIPLYACYYCGSLWGNYCSFNIEKLQDELFGGERNSRGKSGTSRLAKHRCTHFPQVSSPLFSTTVLLSAFFAARGNRNNYCSHKF